jgi:hypothetical protein
MIVFTILWKTQLKYFLIPDLTIFILQQFDFFICYLNREVFIYSTFNRIDCTSITIFITNLIPFFRGCFCVSSTILSFNFLITISNRLIDRLVGIHGKWKSPHQHTHRRLHMPSNTYHHHL